MTALCAGCLEPIPKSGTDSRFVISGTEAFHSRCAHLISSSVLTKYRVRVNELKAKLAGGAINGAEAARLRTRVEDLERELRESINRVESLRVEYNRLHGEKHRVETDLINANIRLANVTATTVADANAVAVRERDDARRELAEAKAELARIRGVPNEGSTKDANFPDDLSIRAGLLEID